MKQFKKQKKKTPETMTHTLSEIHQETNLKRYFFSPLGFVVLFFWIEGKSKSLFSL